MVSVPSRHVPKGEAGGAPDFGRSEGAAGSGGAPHYYVPPQIFRLLHMPSYYLATAVKILEVH